MEKTGLLAGKKHVFSFPLLEGAFTLEPPSVAITLDARALELHDEWVSAKDFKQILDFARSAEVLDVAKHPAIRFRSTQVEEKEPGRFRVRGELNLKGIGRQIEVEVTRRNERFEGRSVFAMSSFGIKPPKAALGAVGTRDAVTAVFALLAAR